MKRSTTLLYGISAFDTVIGLTSTEGVTCPVNMTGRGITYMYCGMEMMKVSLAPRDANWVPDVSRGVEGTIAAPHAAGEPVLIGGPADFPNFTPTQGLPFSH